MRMLEGVPGAAPQLVDLAALSLLDQLRLLARTDLYIGVQLMPRFLQDIDRQLSDLCIHQDGSNISRSLCLSIYGTEAGELVCM